MRLKVILALGLLLIAFSGHAFGQASLPWARSEQPKVPEKEEVLESQLPLVRARIEGSGEVWVGQAVSLNVEVIVPSWFAGAPKFPELEVSNAVTLSPEAAVNFVVQSAGKTFSAQGRRYLIFPQVKGKYTVPSAKVEVTYAMPDGKPSTPKFVASPSLVFEAWVPAGAEAAKYFLTTKKFHINQSLDRKLEGLKVGDSITRTINMTADDTVGITLPPLSFEAPEGLRLYTGVPKISEKAERGRIEAARMETATYILEKEGRYKLPEIVILWWDPFKKKMNKAGLPAIEFQVEANAGYSTEVFASSEEIGGKPSDEPKQPILDRLKGSIRWVFVALGSLAFLLIIRRILFMKGTSIRSFLTEKQRQRANAEATYFKRFRKASLSNDARSALRELMVWLDRLNTQLEASTLERFTKESGNPELLKEVDALEGLLFSRSGGTGPSKVRAEWSGKSFYKLVARARRAQIRRSERLNQSRDQLLSLNPEKHILTNTRSVAVILAALVLVSLSGCATSFGKRTVYHFEPAYGVASLEFEHLMETQAGGLPNGNQVMLLNNGDTFFPAILEAIRLAKASVNIELFIFARGRMAERFVEALCAKAREGVDVRVLVDSVGERLGKLADQMRAAGVKFQIYKPTKLRSIAKTGDRTHRKIITVDGRVGFTGGLAIDDRWAGDARNSDEWRDTVVRLEGPVVLLLQRLFLEDWLYTTGDFLDGDSQFPVAHKVGNVKAQAIGSSRTSQLSIAKLHYYMPIQAAREHIWIENAYFLPDADLKAALCTAARRGVDVRIVVPGQYIDLKAVRYASRGNYRELLEAGIKIYEFQPTMLHSKVMVVDNVWSSIGSINFSSRSMKANAEANVAIYDQAFAAQVKGMIEADIARSEQIMLEQWKQRNLYERIKERYFGLYKDLF